MLCFRFVSECRQQTKKEETEEGRQQLGEKRKTRGHAQDGGASECNCDLKKYVGGGKYLTRRIVHSKKSRTGKDEMMIQWRSANV